jgi:hypothetical protein
MVVSTEVGAAELAAGVAYVHDYENPAVTPGARFRSE